MSAYHGGLVWLRVPDLSNADQIDFTARAVLSVMASFTVGDSPECYAANETIAHKANLGLTAVKEAQKRLAKQGLIERKGKRGKTVRWLLTVLCDPNPLVAGSRPQAQGPLVVAKRPQEPTSREATTRTSREATTILPTLRSASEGEKSREHREHLRSAPVPGATSELARWAAGELGLSDEQAEVWIAERLAAANGGARNPRAYIRACVEQVKASESIAGPQPKATKRKAAKRKATGAKPKGEARFCRECNARLRDGSPATLCKDCGDRIIARIKASEQA